MILYKYFSPDRVDVLRDGMIRFTQLAAVNDPLDCRPRILQPDELSSVPYAEHQCCVTSYVTVLQEALLTTDRRSIGMLCLTEKEDNLLMWSHYAQNHEGFVIGFDTDHEFFSKTENGTGLWKVKYSFQRPALPKEVFEEEVSRQPNINPLASGMLSG